MSDSSILFPVNSSLGCSALQTDQQPISLYIPVIPPNLYFISSSIPDDDEQKSKRFQPKFLKYYIENCMRVGKVRRIDFATREVPQYATPQVCAFVHFDCLYENASTNEMLSSLEKEGKYRTFGFENQDPQVNGPDFFKFCGAHSRPHLLFKINHKPIETPKEYERNIEQVMAENKLLIERLQDKEETLRQVQEFLQTWDSTEDSNVVIALSGLRQLMGKNEKVSTEEVEL